jgi:hypothetical protein
LVFIFSVNDATLLVALFAWVCLVSVGRSSKSHGYASACAAWTAAIVAVNTDAGQTIATQL